MERFLCVQVLLYMPKMKVTCFHGQWTLVLKWLKTVTYIPQNFHLIHDYSSSEMYQTKYAYGRNGSS